MDFIINKFSILAPTYKKAFSQGFSKGINLFVGEKDTGKSTLARAILYTLGCDVKNFDLQKKSPENVYVLDFSVGLKNYILVRRKLKTGKGRNYFKVIENNRSEIYYDTKSFKEKLNDILNIKLVTIDKDNNETRLYPNHIFLPFYTDQDYSWQNYLSSTFNGINFIKNYRKLILEYFVGARSNKYYNLQLKKSQKKIKFLQTDALIKSKNLIIKENIENIKIVENIDVDDFKKNYNQVLKLYQNIIDTEHKLKEQLNEKLYKKNTLEEMKTKVNLSIDKIIKNEIEKECPTCLQRIDNKMEQNYRLLLSRENLINEREKVKMYLKEIDSSIKITMEEVKNMQLDQSQLKHKLDADASVVSLVERADSYALSRVNIKLEEELSKLLIERTSYEEDLEELEKELNNLNVNDVSIEYNKLMIDAFNDLNIPLNFNNYYTSNLESVNINLSGASKVQAYIAQYLTIYEMNQINKDVVSLPMFIDTFLKDDFNEKEIMNTTNFIFSRLSNSPQSFVFISNNVHTLDILGEYNFNQINLQQEYDFFDKNYQDIYDKYSEIIEL